MTADQCSVSLSHTDLASVIAYTINFIGCIRPIQTVSLRCFNLMYCFGEYMEAVIVITEPYCAGCWGFRRKTKKNKKEQKFSICSNSNICGCDGTWCADGADAPERDSRRNLGENLLGELVGNLSLRSDFATQGHASNCEAALLHH